MNISGVIQAAADLSILSFLRKVVSSGYDGDVDGLTREPPRLPMLRDDWAARDLRYVRFLETGHVVPLCPAVLNGLSHFLMAVALETEDQDPATLIGTLQQAVDSNALPPSAEGYAKEKIFLTKLARKRNTTIRVSASSAAQPTRDSRVITFRFDAIKLVEGFNHSFEFTKYYAAMGSSVLYIPRKPNEEFIDAAVYNYPENTTYAIQVRNILEHELHGC